MLEFLIIVLSWRVKGLIENHNLYKMSGHDFKKQNQSESRE